jgi:ribose-phosphate pyrophosphokinase
MKKSFKTIFNKKSITCLFGIGVLYGNYKYKQDFLGSNSFLKQNELFADKKNQIKDSFIYDPLWRSKIRKPISEDISQNYPHKKLDICLIAGSGNHGLAEEVADRLSLPLSKSSVTKNEDGELGIKLTINPEGKELFLIQAICPPVNDKLAELLFTIAEAKRLGATKVNVIIPYLGYSKKNTSLDHKSPIQSADISKMLEIAGADYIATVELHSSQIEGFYNIPIDNIPSSVVLSEYLYNSNLFQNFNNLLVVSPDVNGVKRAKTLADSLAKKTGIPINMAFSSIEEPDSRLTNKSGMDLNDCSKKNIVVGNVEGYDCLIVDDLVKSGRTIISCAEELKKKGAKKVIAFVTHCMLNLYNSYFYFIGLADDAVLAKIDKSVIERIIVTNTTNYINCSKKLNEISVGPLIAEIIRRQYLNESLSDISFH